MDSESAAGGQGQGLHRDAVGLVAVLFQSVANMAPGAAVAFSILFAAPYAGGATPLAVLIGLGLCLLVAITIGQLAKHLPSAGGLYTYNARGLGTGFGFMVGWAFLLAELVVVPGGLLILGIVTSTVFHTHLGWPTWTWAPFAASAGLIVWFLVWRGIKLSTAASVALGVFELAVFLALAITLKALVFQGTISTIVIVAIYMVTGLSCVAYYLRERRDEFNVVLHGLIPCASFILFLPVLLVALGVNFAGLGITSLAAPANEAPYVIYGWLALGIVVLIYFLVTDRSRIARTGLVFEEAEPETPPPPPERG
jgi:amino acid permease